MTNSSNKAKLSFTDASIILTMEEFKITNLLSFDKEFKKVKQIVLIDK